MGLSDADLVDLGNGGKLMVAAVSVACSICLETVVEMGDRSWAKLQCGHQFHLDCIGSAFNSKGSMQCPNCRKTEKGQWLYANGNRSLPELNMDDWTHDEDMHDVSFSEMSFGMQWCPFSGLTRLPTFDEGEFSSNAYHDLIGHHAIFAEQHTPMFSATRHCPYVTYFGPLHPSSATSGSVSDGSVFSNPWNGHSVLSEVPSSYDFPSMDAHFHNRIGIADEPSAPSVNQRALRNGSDMPRPGMLPFIVSHSSTSRPPSSSVVSSDLPPHPGAVSRPRDHAPPVQPHLQQSNHSPSQSQFVSSSRRRSSSHRGVAQAVPIASASDQPNGFFNFFPSNPSGRTFQEPENTRYDLFQSWEQEHQPSSSLNLVERDSIWGLFHAPAGGSDAGRSGGFSSRHGSDRMQHRWS